MCVQWKEIGGGRGMRRSSRLSDRLSDKSLHHAQGLCISEQIMHSLDVDTP